MSDSAGESVASVASIPDHTAPASNLRLYEELFHQIDTDGSGCIDTREMATALEGLGVHLEQHQVDKLIHLLDINDDGEMQLDEFIHFLYVCENSRADDIATVLFLVADTDCAQAIDARKFKTIMEKLGARLSDDEVGEIMRQVADNEDGTMGYEMFRTLMEEIIH